MKNINFETYMKKKAGVIPKEVGVVLVFIFFTLPSFSQEKLIISEKQLDSTKVRRTYVYLRDDLNGFEKVNETTYRMIGINDSCDNSNPVSIDGVQTFGSMPCFRDYIIQKAGSDNKIITWGKLEVQEIEFSSVINNWETDKVNYVGSWKGAMANGEPGDGCGCSYSLEVGDYLEIEFYGTGISFYGERNDHLNTAEVYLDGEFVNNINEYADIPANNNPVELIRVNGQERSTHILRVVVTGNEPLSTGTGFVFHKAVIENNDDNIIISDTLFTRQDTVYIEKIVYDTVYIDNREVEEFSSVRNGFWKISVNGVLLDRNFTEERTSTSTAIYLKHLNPNDIIQVIPPEKYEIK